MSISFIRKTFENRLKSWADSQSPKIPVAYQNKAFSKPVSGMYLEAIMIPNATLSRGVAGVNKTYIGFYQVNVWINKNQGLGDAEVAAETISSLFPVVPKLLGVSVDAPPTIGRAISDDSGWNIIPVLINYRYETNG